MRVLLVGPPLLPMLLAEWLRHRDVKDPVDHQGMAGAGTASQDGRLVPPGEPRPDLVELQPHLDGVRVGSGRVAVGDVQGLPLGRQIVEPDAIRRLAEIAFEVNERTENIGARRLYTVMEKLLEEISFEAGRKTEESIVIDADYVDGKLKELARSEDLARYVL